jgi:putative zinc finger/helix-turn-helix YgiT family protein
MDCVICGGNAKLVTEQKQARYRGEVVEVTQELYRCESCQEGFVTPGQAGDHVRAVKNEIRKKYGLLSPERIVEIRNKLGLTQVQLEELLNTGSKVVVRWESGKVIQGDSHDTVLRLLEKWPSELERVRQIQELRSQEQREYETRARDARGRLACTA